MNSQENEIQEMRDTCEIDSQKIVEEILAMCSEHNILKEKMSMVEVYTYAKAFIKVACAIGMSIVSDAPQEVKESLVQILCEEVVINLGE